mgnify:CR=1 FL=1
MLKFYIEKQVTSKKKPLSKSISGIVYSDYENGNRQFEATFTEGVMNGMYKLWHDNEQLQLKMQYKEGVKEGTFIRWYKNGQIDTETKKITLLSQYILLRYTHAVFVGHYKTT